MPKINYTGYQDLVLNEDQFVQLYTEKKLDGYTFIENEYLIARDESGSIRDKLCFRNGELKPIKYSTFSNAYTGSLKPRNEHQELAFEMLKNKDGSPAFDPEDSVFYQLPEDYSEKGENMIHEINMDIRAEAHSKAINDDLNYLSLKCGFGTDRYRFEAGSVKTATEVISENSDMFRMLKKHEIILDDVLKELIRIIIRLGMVLNVPLNPDAEITIDFDDSIIEDKVAERNTDRQDVAMGTFQAYEYRAKWRGESEEEAKSKIQNTEGMIE